MEFFKSLAAYLFLGGIVALYAKNTDGERISNRDNWKLVFPLCTLIWPAVLLVMIVLWISGDYKKKVEVE